MAQGSSDGTLSNYDMALARRDSITIVSVDVYLEKFIDLLTPRTLAKFVAIIRISLSRLAYGSAPRDWNWILRGW